MFINLIWESNLTCMSQMLLPEKRNSLSWLLGWKPVCTGWIGLPYSPTYYKRTWRTKATCLNCHSFSHNFWYNWTTRPDSLLVIRLFMVYNRKLVLVISGWWWNFVNHLMSDKEFPLVIEIPKVVRKYFPKPSRASFSVNLFP